MCKMKLTMHSPEKVVIPNSDSSSLLKKIISLLEKQPFTTLIARRKGLRQCANARQGRPCHKERRHAFTTRNFDARLRHAMRIKEGHVVNEDDTHSRVVTLRRAC